MTNRFRAFVKALPAPVALACIAFAMIVGPAFAQTATSNAIDLSPLFTQVMSDYAFPVIIALVMAIAGWALTKWAAFLPASTRKMVLDELDVLLEQGKGLAASKITSMKDFNLHIDNPVIVGVANQLIAEVRPLLTKLGITPTSVEDWVAKKIVAKLGNDSLADPDVPAPAGALPGTNVTVDGTPVLAPAPAN